MFYNLTQSLSYFLQVAVSSTSATISLSFNWYFRVANDQVLFFIIPEQYLAVRSFSIHPFQLQVQNISCLIHALKQLVPNPQGILFCFVISESIILKLKRTTTNFKKFKLVVIDLQRLFPVFLFIEKENLKLKCFKSQFVFVRLNYYNPEETKQKI